MHSRMEMQYKTTSGINIVEEKAGLLRKKHATNIAQHISL